MKRELTPEEEEFIKNTLAKKSISYDSEKKEYVKKEKSEKVNVGALSWTLFRPRNWSILIILIAILLFGFFINAIQGVSTLMGTGLFTYIEESGMSLEQFAAESGMNIDSAQGLLTLYENRAMILSGILIVAIFLIAVLFILDLILQDRRNRKNEVK